MSEPLKYAYFPGCSMHGTGKEYGTSSAAICDALGIELAEIPDWNCCGASSAHGADHVLSTALAARNIATAERMGMDTVAACAACFNRLAAARADLEGDARLQEQVNPLLPHPWQGTSRVRPLLDVVVTDVGLDAVKEKVTQPLEGLKAACYYGCLLVRPPEVTQFDRPEDPQSMDHLVEALGAEAVKWPHKTECCGASFALTRTDIVLRMTGDVLRSAKQAGADCVVCACPLCMANLDMRQPEIEKKAGVKLDLPVLYFTELMGIAMGVGEQKDWLRMHFVDPSGLVGRIPAGVTGG